MPIAKLRETRARALERLGSEEVVNDAALYEATEKEISEIEAKINRAESAKARAAALAEPAHKHASSESQEGVEGYVSAMSEELTPAALGRRLATADGVHSFRARAAADPLPRKRSFDEYLSIARAANGIRVPDRQKHFRSFGEQLQAVYNFYTTRGTNVDSRLVRAPTGAGEVDPTGGGFLVQTDFAQAVFMLAHDTGELLGRVNKIPLGDKFNGIKIPGVDETSRATGSRWGGVNSQWADEGTSGTPSKPKFRMIEFSLHKLISSMYTTDEMLQDSTALTTIASQAFSEEVIFMTEDGVWEGSGVGMPLGVLNSPAKITVPSRKGQTTKTIIKGNIDDMWARMWARSRPNSVWLINQDIEPQLLDLNQPVGAGGVGGTLLYMPAGGLSAKPYAELYGRPVIATEYNPTVGTEGDLALVDLGQYTLVDKGGVQAATSMHVAFLTDQMVFRVTYRVDGKPMWAAPLTPFAVGGLTKSPFITLASR